MNIHEFKWYLRFGYNHVRDKKPQKNFKGGGMVQQRTCFGSDLEGVSDNKTKVENPQQSCYLLSPIKLSSNIKAPTKSEFCLTNFKKFFFLEIYIYLFFWAIISAF